VTKGFLFPEMRILRRKGKKTVEYGKTKGTLGKNE